MPTDTGSVRAPAGAFVAAWALVSGGIALALAPRAIGHDQATLLVGGWKVLHGAVLFRDVLDINSPLVQYVHALPAAAAAATGTNLIPWFTSFLVILSAWSALLADRAFLATAREASWPERLAIMLVPLGPCTFHLTAADPGQREHLFVLLYFPFLMYRIAAAKGAALGSTRGRFALGVVAAIGVGLKPHFLLPAAGAEAGLLLAGASPRLLLAPEIAGAMTCAGATAGFLLLLPLDARRTLLEHILPLVLHGYSAYDTGLAVIHVRAARRAVLALVLAIVAWRAGPRRLQPAILPVTGFCLGAIESIVLQGKDFGYHYIPSDAALLFLSAAAALSLARGRAAKPVNAAFAAAIVIAVCIWRPIYAVRVTRPDVYPFRDVLRRYTQPGDGVIVLSTSSIVYPAALQMDRPVLGRESALLLILAIEDDAVERQPGRQAGYVVDGMSEDIRTARPAAVFIDRSGNCQACPPGFNLATYLEADPRIRQALDGYTKAAVAQNLDVFLKRAP